MELAFCNFPHPGDGSRPTCFPRALLILHKLFPMSVQYGCRLGNRRSFDAIERLLPQDILYAAYPNETLEAYHESV